MSSTPDVSFTCGRCSTPYLHWLAEVGQWRCRYHPGVAEIVEVAGRHWRRYSCCGYCPELTESAPRTATVFGLYVTAALYGCTPCDHAAAYEDVAVPIYAFKEVLAPFKIAGGRCTVSTNPKVLSDHAALAQYSNVFWTHYAPKVNRDAWAAVLLSRTPVSARLASISSWMPRQQSIYDTSEQVDADSAAAAANSPGGKLWAEALRNQKRLALRRLALGLSPEVIYDPDAVERLKYITLPDVLTSLSLIQVQRREKPPDDAARTAIRAASQQLLSFFTCDADDTEGRTGGNQWRTL